MTGGTWLCVAVLVMACGVAVAGQGRYVRQAPQPQPSCRCVKWWDCPVHALAVCRDLDPSCETWRASGQCDTNPTYMLKRCPKSCNSCPTENQPTNQPSVGCSTELDVYCCNSPTTPSTTPSLTSCRCIPYYLCPEGQDVFSEQDQCENQIDVCCNSVEPTTEPTIPSSPQSIDLRVPGMWGSWGLWDSCNAAPCGQGLQVRRRLCDSPTPRHGGPYCQEDNTESRLCDLPCPLNGKWSPWKSWSECSVTCGTGVQMRQRLCDSPAPKHGGLFCQGDDRDSRPCSDLPCQVDGKWSPWKPWSECSATCGSGIQMRQRLCDSPAPGDGGRHCQGDSLDHKICAQECPVVGTTCDSRAWMCDCPQPNDQFCVPCQDVTQSCAMIDSAAVCSIGTLENKDTVVTISVLSCGHQPFESIPGLKKRAGAPSCGTSQGVPERTVTKARCWGITNVLAQCHADGTWRPYGDGENFEPITHLCQFNYINSPVCGVRAKYSKASGTPRSRGSKPQFPWLVQVLRSGRYACTGTIITPNFIITAAHCLTTTQLSPDVLGLEDVKIEHLNQNSIRHKSKVSAIHLPSTYQGGSIPSKDIALIRLEEPIKFSDKVFPACIIENDGPFPVDAISATFSPDVRHFRWDLSLQQFDARCHSPFHCNLNFDKEGQFCGIDTITQEVLQKGSSGGPYLVNTGNDPAERWVVVAVVSAFTNTCGGDDHTIFTAVDTYVPWITGCVHLGQCN